MTHLHDHQHEHRHGDGALHTHDHEGEHDHDHGPLESITHVQGGAAALNIGGDIGALVVYVDGATVGSELFVRSDDDPSLSVHTGVWWRDTGKGGKDQVAAALFCELREGTYWLLDPSGADVCAVEVNGGALSELDLRT